MEGLFVIVWGGINLVLVLIFIIGLLLGVIEVVVLEWWCVQVKFGEMKLYVIGLVLLCILVIVMFVCEYVEVGLVYLKQKKCDGYGYEFLVECVSVVGWVVVLQWVCLVDDVIDVLCMELICCVDWQCLLLMNMVFVKLCELVYVNVVKYWLKCILNEGVFCLIDNGLNWLCGVVWVLGVVGVK